MHNKGFIRQAYRTGARKQNPPGSSSSGPGLGIVSSLHHNDINTCPLPPSTLHPWTRTWTP